MTNKIELIDNKLQVKTSYFTDFSGHIIDNIKHIILKDDINDYDVIKNPADILYIEYEYFHHKLPNFFGKGKFIHYDPIKYNIKICLKNSLFHNNSGCAFICNGKQSYYFNGILYEYNDWLVLPERIRELREDKLSIL